MDNERNFEINLKKFYDFRIFPKNIFRFHVESVIVIKITATLVATCARAHDSVIFMHFS